MTFKFDRDVMPGKLWMAAALVWPIWLAFAIAAKPETRRHWIITVTAGIVLLIPTVPTIYTFVMWSVEGFAP